MRFAQGIPAVRTGPNARYAYDAPPDDHTQAMVRVRFLYTTARAGTTTRQATTFSTTESYGLRTGEAAFVTATGLGALIE